MQGYNADLYDRFSSRQAYCFPSGALTKEWSHTSKLLVIRALSLKTVAILEALNQCPYFILDNFKLIVNVLQNICKVISSVLINQFKSVPGFFWVDTNSKKEEFEN
jgi:hypothetical protein